MIKKFKPINKAYKFIIYPNQEQQELIDKTIGCSRFIYNEFLAKSKEVKGKINNVTVSKSRTGKYYISINVKEVIKTVQQDNQAEVGIDLGIKDFAILSNGETINNPRHLSKHEDKLAKLQKRLARKEEGSNNWIKLKKKVAKIHEKIKNVRKDFLHKLSTRLTKENQLICLEDLNIKGMLKNSKLAKHISNVAWSKFTTMLEYKGKWYDCILHKVDRFFVSSQTCSECGKKNPKVKDLSVREWTCECGASHNRDLNASLNILNQGKLELEIN